MVRVMPVKESLSASSARSTFSQFESPHPINMITANTAKFDVSVCRACRDSRHEARDQVDEAGFALGS